MAELDDLIVCTPGNRGGKPRIMDRRITVADVAIMHLHQGQPVAEIVADYDLAPAAVHAALAYYYLHQDAIDRSIEEDRNFAQKFREENPSLVRGKLQPSAGR